ncbi:MAG: hypothetical protein KA734_00750 [Fluviicola sp.]|nr:hypothetical protein [Fluviicola sp.]MBP6271330.1 hypothetical protein [Fluviicola sp.]
MKNIALFITICIALYSCNNHSKVKSSFNFIGKWELTGHGIMDGIIVKIEYNKEKKLIGKVCQLNDNKLVNMFLDSNSVFISSIERRSQFQFILKEKKIGSELFDLYGLDTRSVFQAQFRDKDTIVLSKDQSNTNINGSLTKLIRIKE